MWCLISWTILFGRPRRHSFYEPNAFVTWVARIIRHKQILDSRYVTSRMTLQQQSSAISLIISIPSSHRHVYHCRRPAEGQLRPRGLPIVSERSGAIG